MAIQAINQFDLVIAISVLTTMDMIISNDAGITNIRARRS
jgi:hypothetical protein